uniref:Uncharacterized protein n=1 Tax=Anguilla anguilla TaxID=7936 RepID=A0A0E9UWR2_ANGAN
MYNPKAFLFSKVQNYKVYM